MMSSQRIIRSIPRHHVLKSRLVKHYLTESEAGRNSRQAYETLRTVVDKLESKTWGLYALLHVLINFFVHKSYIADMKDMKTEIIADMKDMKTEIIAGMKDMKTEMKGIKADIVDIKIQLGTTLALLTKRGST
ncbi:hypothetical protein BGX38DRAFT_201138 [Terfezia claveryi]|nr:hypothetical protein BGX38DRAFT_201138 [Terfezia claveryi]